MRLAIAQHRSGLPTVNEQVARLHGMAPGEYHIEHASNARAAQRIAERLERLGPGDSLVINQLAVLGESPQEVLAKLSSVMDCGAAIQAFDADGKSFELGVDAAAAIRSLAQIPQAMSKPRRRPKSAPPALSEADREEIKRLYDAGMPPQRIGRIFRCRPAAIVDVICGRP